jgi:hypothetical protein
MPAPPRRSSAPFAEHAVVEAVLRAYSVLYGDLFITSGTLENPAPVSINDLYTTFRGKRQLTKAGRAYRDGLASVVARSSLEWKTAVDAVYKEGSVATLLVGLYFKSLNNKSWTPGARTASGALQEPRKKQDSGNYLKIIEDAVVQGSGIDDCNNNVHLILKEEDPVHPRTEIIYIIRPA